jgi:hypothetical protein
MTEEMTNDQLVNMVKKSFPKEYAIMQQSLINFYHLKNREDKTSEMIMLQQQLFNGIHSILFVMSKALSEEINVDSRELFKQIYNIHVK